MSKSDESLEGQLKALRSDPTAKRLLREVENLQPERREKLTKLLENRTYTPEETATLLGVHLGTVRRWLREGTLKGTKLRRTWIIPKVEIEKILGQTAEGQTMEVSTTDAVVETFKNICADQDEDPGEIMKMLMAEYIQAARQTKEQEAMDERNREETKRLADERQKNAKITI